ncbi:MAG TPA: ribonuclease P protein component [Ottowia sp.]|uniref:ribonuclease P protein component n=1 Tax=Ottowia sp. TaxID=1898956 RepID=UPI002C829AD8|nr:ribonuclease P protein component [Ottowia sp.]HMN19935.1 ribonuclease P protein component [Ottowia sp.]
MQRLRTRAQFQALLAERPVARTPHFAWHRLQEPVPADGSTASQGPWLGALVPKRWARRAVTRNAIRRQVHALGAARLAALPGAHLIRLRAAFPVDAFPSASSRALKRAVRAELEQLLAQARP